MTLSTNFGWDIPDVNADSDTWGALTNDIWAIVDQMLAGQALGDEATVASAATANIGAANRNRVQITGTTTITSFGTTANCLKVVRFAGVLTLTHNGTSLILPGAANRTTAAGDVGIYMSDASGNWREISYATASGPNGLVKLATLTASNSASLADTTSLTGAYKNYLIVVTNVLPATNGTTLLMQFSTNGGSSYDSGANYTNSTYYINQASVAGSACSAGANSIQMNLSASLSNAAPNNFNAALTLLNVTASSGYKHISSRASYNSSAGYLTFETNAGVYSGSVSAINAVRFSMASGNIASGTIEIYGMK